MSELRLQHTALRYLWVVLQTRKATEPNTHRAVNFFLLESLTVIRAPKDREDVKGMKAILVFLPWGSEVWTESLKGTAYRLSLLTCNFNIIQNTSYYWEFFKRLSILRCFHGSMIVNAALFLTCMKYCLFHLHWKETVITWAHAK